MAPIARPKPQDVLRDIEAQFTLDEPALVAITKQFVADFGAGLGDYGHPMAMIPTFVTGVPDGTETGTFLALDLGGTNLRVCEVQLHGDQTFTLRQQKYRVSDQLKTGEAVALFNYLADSVDAFLTDSGYDFPDSESSAVPLGLTFSFPVEQRALDSGTLLTWTKGFAARNAIGNDVVKLLQDAFDRKHMHVRCVALVNDTVGALLSRAYTAGGCLLGAIFGTGTNGAYVEDVSRITKLRDSAAAAAGGSMVVNTEWGAFNNSRSTLPSTLFDNKLDRESINPRFQAFEKFISGMYLGEIARNVLLHLVDAAPAPLLFAGRATKQLNTHYGLDTAVMSAVEEAWAGPAPDPATQPAEGACVADAAADPPNIASAEGAAELAPAPHLAKAALDVPALFGAEKDDAHGHGFDADTRARLERVRGVLVSQLGFDADDAVSLRDAALVHWVCGLVATRAAKLSGCAVAAVVVQTGHAPLLADGAPKPTATTTTTDTATATAAQGAGQKIAVGVDGSLIQFYPGFEDNLRASLRALVGREVERMTEIGMAKDGSGVGAALCALQAMKQIQRNQAQKA